MKRKRIYSIVCMCIIMTHSYGQKIAYATLSSGALFNKSISVVVGQLANSTLKSTNIMTQGFLQPYSSNPISLPINKDISIEIYPNPVIDVLNINSQKGVNYSIYNINGVLIASGNTSTTTIVDMSNQTSGTYIILVEGVAYKIIKQ